MRKDVSYTVTMVLILFAILALPVESMSRTLYVNNDPDKLIAHAYKTIKECIQVASEGDLIMLWEGSYFGEGGLRTTKRLQFLVFDRKGSVNIDPMVILSDTGTITLSGGHLTTMPATYAIFAPKSQLPSGPHFETRFDNPYRETPYWHKGQVHVHSIRFNPDWTTNGANFPEDIMRSYQRRGYTFLALTDHDQPCNTIHTDPGVSGISYIPSEEDCNVSEDHLLCIGLTRMNDPCGPMCEWSHQRRIDHVYNQHAIAVIAHPAGGGWNGDEFKPSLGEEKSLRHFHGLEIYNPGHEENGDNKKTRAWWDGWNLDPWVAANHGLLKETRVWGFAGDDCHSLQNKNSFNKGWIAVGSMLSHNWFDGRYTEETKALVRHHIIANIRVGNFFAVTRHPSRDDPTGFSKRPLSIYTHGEELVVKSNAICEELRFIYGPVPAIIGPVGAVVKVPSTNQTVFKLPPPPASNPEWKYNFVRIECDQYIGGDMFTIYSQPLIIVNGGYKGKTVANADIRFTNDDGQIVASKSSNTNGDYQIYVPRGTFRVDVLHPDYERYSGTVEHKLTNAWDSLDIPLRRRQ